MADRPKPDAAQPPGPAEPTEAGSPTLEARMARLREIVEALEADRLELDQALALFEEAVGHIRAAEQLIAEAELRVEELRRESGDTTLRPFGSESQ